MKYPTDQLPTGVEKSGSEKYRRSKPKCMSDIDTMKNIAFCSLLTK